MTRVDRILTTLIRLNAAVLLLAAVPIFFPMELMARLHQDMGLGSLAQDRITAYLTRSASACYTMHGAVLILLSMDVRRYRHMIDGMYVIHFIFALSMLGIDLHAGMPSWWIAAEVGTIATVAVVILSTNQLAKRADARANQSGC